MKIETNQLIPILDKIRIKNDVKYRDELLECGEAFAKSRAQIILPPESLTKGIPTLAAEIYQRPSPMLTIRFNYAGAWRRAVINNSLLGIKDMEKVWTNDGILEQVHTREEFWDESPMRLYSRDKISLFAADSENNWDEVYLVWADVATEPKVVSYVGNVEERFDSIGDFFLFFSGDF